MNRTVSWVVTAALVLVGAPAAAQTASPTRIILFIGDGTGVGQWTAATFAADHLAVARMPVAGLVDTRASDAKVTDSAAAATAYASGVRTYNGAIGVGPDSAAVPTILELAAERGMATGLVATSSITHATPAAFAAHVPSRSMETEIARQMIQDHDITVLIGGGRAYFDGARRPDSLDLLAGPRAGGAYAETPEAFMTLDLVGADRLFALLTTTHMPPAVRAVVPPPEHVGQEAGLVASDTTWEPLRTPSLAMMTRGALSVLDRDPDGFFLMVEGSQIDWRSHDNAPLEAVVAEVLDFDRAIGEALAYQERHPETLIVVAADHETGGLAVHGGPGGSLVAGYTSGGHTANLIPLFARGPGAEAFGGLQQSYEVGQKLIAALRGP